ncbi:MAG: hypothetical protein K8J09_10390 [Planctomycetes bacterium]|nr:hypothetical protein [Planctomycetota bacterium]MCC7397284.1 hypothetical protein [Planctomycetota bacterium]
MKPVLPPFLQESFDRGVDPLDDDATRVWLQQHPEHLHAFAALRATLREVAGLPPQRSWPGRWRPLWFFAGAAALLVAAWLTGSSAAATVLPRPLFAPRAAVLSITTTERIADGTRAFVFARVQGTLSQKASATFSTCSTGRQLPTVFLRTTVREETVRP